MKLYFDVIDQNVILSYVTYNLNKKWFFFFKIRDYQCRLVGKELAHILQCEFNFVCPR